MWSMNATILKSRIELFVILCGSLIVVRLTLVMAFFKKQKKNQFGLRTEVVQCRACVNSTLVSMCHVISNNGAPKRALFARPLTAVLAETPTFTIEIAILRH